MRPGFPFARPLHMSGVANDHQLISIDTEQVRHGLLGSGRLPAEQVADNLRLQVVRVGKSLNRTMLYSDFCLHHFAVQGHD